MADVPAGSFDCIKALAPKCTSPQGCRVSSSLLEHGKLKLTSGRLGCNTVLTTSVGVDSVGLNTGCVAATKLGELSTCKGLGNKFGICCDDAVVSANRQA